MQNRIVIASSREARVGVCCAWAIRGTFRWGFGWPPFYRQSTQQTSREAVAGLPAGLVFAGFSLGAVHAEVLAASRPGALGAVLMHGAVPVEGLSEYFGVDRWPEGVPVQVHYSTSDPWVEAEEEVAPLGDAVRGAGAEFEEHAYPGSGHLFTDPDLPEYDPASSEEMWERVLAFLDRSTPEGQTSREPGRPASPP